MSRVDTMIRYSSECRSRALAKAPRGDEIDDVLYRDAFALLTIAERPPRPAPPPEDVLSALARAVAFDSKPRAPSSKRSDETILAPSFPVDADSFPKQQLNLLPGSENRH
jgi:hypothetical protein